MNPYLKGTQFLFRLVAIGIMLIGGMMVGLEFLNLRAHGTHVSAVRVVLYSLSFIAGGVLFIISPSLSSRLTDEVADSEEETPPDS